MTAGSTCLQVLQVVAREVATAAAKTVLSGGSNDEMAAELFDLVGDGGFEAIQELVTYRSAHFDS